MQARHSRYGTTKHRGLFRLDGELSSDAMLHKADDGRTALEDARSFVVAADLRELDVWAKVDESDIAKIAVGESDLHGGLLSWPRVHSESNPNSQSATACPECGDLHRCFTARNDDYSLLPGMTVVARIDIQPSKPSDKVSSVLPIPNEVGIR